VCQSTLNQPRTTLSVRHGPHTMRRQHIYICIYFSRSRSLSYSLSFSLSSWKPDEFAVKLISFKLGGPCPESLKLWIPSPLVLPPPTAFSLVADNTAVGPSLTLPTRLNFRQHRALNLIYYVIMYQKALSRMESRKSTV